jgi:hypothetical protein
LSKTAKGCAWTAGPDFTGCIDADKCDSEDYEGSECIFGKTGDKGFNTKTCGGNGENHSVYYLVVVKQTEYYF